jgi:hypothetical protein
VNQLLFTNTPAVPVAESEAFLIWLLRQRFHTV